MNHPTERLAPKSVKFVGDMDRAILVIRNVSQWLEESGKKPTKWWQVPNINRQFLLQYARPDEFYVGLVDGELAAAQVLQLEGSNEVWQRIDGDSRPKALYISWFCVHRRFAGMGLPKFMMAFAVRKARQFGATLLRLDTNAGEPKVRSMYERLGFSLVTEEDEGYRRAAYYQRKI